ncbi:MAG: hypothetical protein ACYS18_13030 [Planctomycetota bacterium]
MVQVTLPDGSTLEITDGTTAKQLAGQKLFKSSHSKTLKGSK